MNVNLTAITTAFGLLDLEVKEKLVLDGGPYQVYRMNGWENITEDQSLGIMYPHLVYRKKPVELVPDQIDWSQLPIEFNLVMRNSFDAAYAFVGEHPHQGINEWYVPINKNSLSIDKLSLYKQGTVDWKDSLQERPKS